MTATSTKPDLRESSDAYSRELYRVDVWRVAVCSLGIQWLLQSRRVSKDGVAGAWDSVSFCLSRDALVRLWRQATGDDGAWLLEHLPERFGGRR